MNFAEKLRQSITSPVSLCRTGSSTAFPEWSENPATKRQLFFEQTLNTLAFRCVKFCDFSNIYNGSFSPALLVREYHLVDAVGITTNPRDLVSPQEKIGKTQKMDVLYARKPHQNVKNRPALNSERPRVAKSQEKAHQRAPQAPELSLVALAEKKKQVASHCPAYSAYSDSKPVLKKNAWLLGAG